MKKLYFLVTADEYELPVCIEESWSALSRATGIHRNTLWKSYHYNKVIFEKYKVEVVNFFS